MLTITNVETSRTDLTSWNIHTRMVSDLWPSFFCWQCNVTGMPDIMTIVRQLITKQYESIALWVKAEAMTPCREFYTSIFLGITLWCKIHRKNNTCLHCGGASNSRLLISHCSCMLPIFHSLLRRTCLQDTWKPGNLLEFGSPGSPRRMSCPPNLWFLESNQTLVPERRWKQNSV